MNNETEAPSELLTLGPWGIAAFAAITIAVLVLGFLTWREKFKAAPLLLLPLLFLAGCQSVTADYIDADEANLEAYEALVPLVISDGLRAEPRAIREAWGSAGSLFAQADEATDPAEKLRLESEAVKVLIDAVTDPFMTGEQAEVWAANLTLWRARIDAAREALESEK